MVQWLMQHTYDKVFEPISVLAAVVIFQSRVVGTLFDNDNMCMMLGNII